MVKDNKFAAEPTADSTADAKTDRTATKVTTTENVVQPERNRETEKKLESTKGSEEDKIYSAYVKGSNVQAIADELDMSTGEVLAVIKKAESERK